MDCFFMPPRIVEAPDSSRRPAEAITRSCQTSPALAACRKADHWVWPKTSVGPEESLESRTAVTGPASATSTQLLPSPLWLLVRQIAPDRSTVIIGALLRSVASRT